MCALPIKDADTAACRVEGRATDAEPVLRLRLAVLHLPPCALQAGRNDHAPGRGSRRIRWRNLARLRGTRPGLVRLLAARQRRVALQAARVSSLSASRQTARLPELMVCPWPPMQAPACPSGKERRTPAGAWRQGERS